MLFDNHKQGIRDYFREEREDEGEDEGRGRR